MRFKERVEINFPENQVTLISGENGSGKTSILDAVCCSLYGKTFRTSGSSVSGFMNFSDLINHESRKADIAVEFENQGHNYIVTRELKKSGSRGTLLEDGETKAIGRTVYNYVKNFAVGLDWEGFRKSTIILQGEMSTLTNLLPSKRKDAFKKLFGIDRYDLYEELAKEKAAGKQQSVEKIEEVNKLLSSETEKIPTLEKDIRKLSKSIENLKKKKRILEKHFVEMKGQKEALEKDYNEFVKLNERFSAIKKELKRLNEQFEEKRQQVTELKKLSKKLPKLEALYKELQQLRAIEKSLIPLKNKYEDLDSQISILNASKDNIQRNVSDRSKKKKKIKIERDMLKKHIPTKKEVEHLRKNLQKEELRLQKTHDAETHLNAEIKNLRKNIRNLKNRLFSVKDQDRCPICFQKISDPTEVRKHYDREITELKSILSNNGQSLGEMKREAAALVNTVTELRKEKDNLETRLAKDGFIKDKKKQLQEITLEINDLKKKVSKLSKNIRKLVATKRELGFDKKEYQKLSKRLSQLRRERITENHSKAITKLAELPKLEDELKKVSKEKSEENRRMKSLTSKLASLKEVKENYTEAKKKLERSQRTLTGISNQITQKTTEKIGNEATLSDLRSKERKLRRNKKTIKELEEDKNILGTLRSIFKNIPEDILRRLRPFIEREGTDIINDLSNSEITTINIDEENLNVSATINGERRPIHYFSGGQKTRINMTLRVAISRILSKLPQTEEHTFATMNTLFIDEGDFGDLDESGIREAINIIRKLTKEFSRVILISHVNSIKDIFHGQLIEVIKTRAEESSLRVSTI